MVPVSESQLLIGDSGKPAYHSVNGAIIKAFSKLLNPFFPMCVV